MTAPLNSRRNVKLRTLALNKETLGNLTADEAEMALGGGKKKKTKLPMTLNVTCDPPTYWCSKDCNTASQTCR